LATRPTSGPAFTKKARKVPSTKICLTGTEHEIRTAIKFVKREVVVWFNDAPVRPKESEQLPQVNNCRKEIPSLELSYEGADDFRDKIRDYLEKYLIAHHPLAPGKAIPAASTCKV
jgi:hypothetical protein